MACIKDLIHIPDHVGRGDFVLRLSEGITDPEGTVKHYQVTPQLVGCFDDALSLVKSSLLVGAGGEHSRQAQALSEYIIDAKDHQGWPVERLKPLLAGLADLIPWLRQWHNDSDPNLGMGLGDYFAGFLEEQCRGLGVTVEAIGELRFDLNG